MRRMKIGLAVLFSALIVGLLVIASFASAGMPGVTPRVNDLSGSWNYEYQDTYSSTGQQLDSGAYLMELHQLGNAVCGYFVVPATETDIAVSEMFCPFAGISEGANITFEVLCIADVYVAKTQIIGNVSLNDTISGFYVGADNIGNLWQGNFTASR